MTDTTESTTDGQPVEFDTVPGGLSVGSTVLIACAGDPTRDALSLQLLCEFVDADDSALVVTTTESADETIERYEHICPASDHPVLGVVDTVSEHQSVTAMYEETPVVFTPSASDLERLVIALSDLSGNAPPSSGARHLLIRSLTPILRAASTARVCTVLERITGLRSDDGLCLLGIDYTAHDEETMAAVAEHIDGVLWVTRDESAGLAFEYRPTRGRYLRSIPGE